MLTPSETASNLALADPWGGPPGPQPAPWPAVCASSKRPTRASAADRGVRLTVRRMPTGLALALFLALPVVSADRGAAHFKNVVVYQELGRFGGWPANQGVWSWGDEIVVGLRSAIFKVNPVSHAVDNSKPQDEYQARSLDGGLTWNIEKPPSLVRPENGGPQPVDPP